MRITLMTTLVFVSWFTNAQLRPFYSVTANKYGYINTTGKVIVEPYYDFAWSFTEGMSPMKLNQKYGYINERGAVIVPPIYDYAWMFSDGLSVVKVGEKFGFINKTGKLVIPAIYDRADNFHVDRANVCLAGKWSVMIYPVKTK